MKRSKSDDGKIKGLTKKIDELFLKEKYKDVIDLLSDQILNQYQDSDLFDWRARAHDRLSEKDKAVEYYTKSLALNPRFDSYIYRGNILYAQGDYDAAIKDYTNAIDLKPDNEIGYYNRATAYSSKEDYDKAIFDFNKSIELKQGYEDAYNNRGIALFKKKEYDKAIDDYSKAIQIKQDFANAYKNRGQVWEAKGDFEKSIADYTKAIELNPQYDLFVRRGNIKFDQSDYDGAIKDYTKAIDLKPKNENGYYNRANAFSNKGDYDKAISDFNKAIELNPGYADAYSNRGIVRYNMKDYDKAFDDYSKAIQLKQDYANAYNNRGTVWEARGDFEKAIEDYTKAIEFDPNHGTAFGNRGLTYYDKGEYQKAITDFEKAIAINSSFNYLDKNLNLAKEKIAEQKGLDQSQASPEHKDEKRKIDDAIEGIINTILGASKSQVQRVVHYTKVFVLDIYVKEYLNNSQTNLTKMHYSNAIYMNDPMEGKIFFEYLNDKIIEEAYMNGERRTETSVYLGSFLPAEEGGGEISHEDELVMWRTYGKDEHGKEAAGCSVVLDSDFFKMRTSKSEESAVKEDPPELLNVIYIRKAKDQKEITNDSASTIAQAIEKLKGELNRLIALGYKYPKTDFQRDIENTIFKRLSTISYLFKSADYGFEKEVRVITYMPRNSEAIKAKRIEDSNKPPKKFYIESFNDILPFVKKIYLGPNVENYQQWSIYLDYEIRQRAKELEKKKKEGETSVPYKINPAEIEIVKSVCKFQ